jgi:AraC-like DNA-binding protein
MAVAKSKDERLFLDRKGGTHNIYVQYKAAQPWPDHWHSYFEIEIVVSGKGMHTLGGDAYEVSEGSAYILTPTDFHKMEPDPSLMLWNISFNESVISNTRLCQLSSKDTKKTFKLDSVSLSKVIKIAELLDEEAKREDEGCCRELCECLLSFLLREEGAAVAYQDDRYSKIKDAIMYLENHFAESPSLEQVASLVGLHPHYFSDLFHKTTGESFCERLNSLRISHAKTLLSKGFSVCDACYNSGFGSLSNFIYRFKKTTGCSPNEYRSRAKK